MVTITFFTTPVPLEYLGALTWPTINQPRYREENDFPEYVVSATLKLEEAQVNKAYGSAGEGKYCILSANQESLLGESICIALTKSRSCGVFQV